MMLTAISLDFSNVGVLGWTIFIVGYVIVFLALISLSTVFKLLPGFLKFLKKSREKQMKRFEKKHAAEKSEPESKEVLTGEVTAAIGYALHLYFDELHDDEDRILTVVHKSRKYSPWNSKIYNVVNFKR